MQDQEVSARSIIMRFFTTRGFATTNEGSLKYKPEDLEEIEDLRKKAGLKSRLSPTEQSLLRTITKKEVFSKIDQNKDGFLSFDEAIALFKADGNISDLTYKDVEEVTKKPPPPVSSLSLDELLGNLPAIDPETPFQHPYEIPEAIRIVKLLDERSNKLPDNDPRKEKVARYCADLLRLVLQDKLVPVTIKLKNELRKDYLRFSMIALQSNLSPDRLLSSEDTWFIRNILMKPDNKEYPIIVTKEKPDNLEIYERIFAKFEKEYQRDSRVGIAVSVQVEDLRNFAEAMALLGNRIGVDNDKILKYLEKARKYQDLLNQNAKNNWRNLVPNKT